MSVTDSQRDLISVQVRPLMQMRMWMMLPWMMVMMLPRSVAPLEEAWEELLARWARTGTGSCGGDLYAGLSHHNSLTCRLQVTENSAIDSLWRKRSGTILLLNSTYFSLLLSLGLIVALVVVSNRTPAGHMVNILKHRKAVQYFLFRCQVVLQVVQVFA